MSIYHSIVEAIDELNDTSLEICEYLKSLKPDVIQLRKSYRKPAPIYVNYSLQNVQSAYLITYFPHYYQLIYKILLEQDLKIFKTGSSFSAVFIGGGPGSEAYGLINYILDYCPNITELSIDILDLNADTWSYSHSALVGYILPQLESYGRLTVKWSSTTYNITDEIEAPFHQVIFQNADIVVIQNCINEIDSNFYPALEKNINNIYKVIGNYSPILMIDLTTSVRSKIANLEELLVGEFINSKVISTSQNRSASAMTSINYRPSTVIRENLLDGSDGLIPRKNLKYDFSLICKNDLVVESKSALFGLNAIYRPLNLLDKSIKNLKEYSYIGIDFGTSNSVCSVAYVKENFLVSQLLRIEQKDHFGAVSTSTIVPSVLGIIENHFLMGRYAQERKSQLIFGENGWYGFKENILELHKQIFPKSRLLNHSEFPINNGADALIVFFKRLKSEIDRICLAKKLPLEKRFCFSTPADYGLKEKETLENYIIKAGFDQGTFFFVDEPLSALIGTIYQENLTLNFKNDVHILVIDVGAGTVDCCAIKLVKDSDNILSETLAVYRNNNIGGDFINKLIAESLCEDLIKVRDVDVLI